MVTGELNYRLAPGNELIESKEQTIAGEVTVLSPRNSNMGWDSTITVTNVGDKSVTLTDAGWWYGHGTHLESVHRPLETSIRFPLRLEPHDQVRLRGFIADDGTAWLYANPPLQLDTPEGIKPAAKPFIDYVQRPWRWRLRKRPGVTRLYAPTTSIDREGM